MQCAESLRVQAYFDAEVDALSAAEIEHHAEQCNQCRELLHDLETMRLALRRSVAYEAAPAALRLRVMDVLDQESNGANAKLSEPAVAMAARQRQYRGWRSGSFWAGAFIGLGGAALAVALAFFAILPRFTNPLINELVSAHVRSLMPEHLIDVVSTDKHTVKPWFAGHADVSPAVVDFDAQGYQLIGGRADYIEHQRSAVVIYQHGKHFINVFSWAAAGKRLPGNVTRSGYHLAFWQQGDIQNCAVSDTGWDELLGLVELLREQT